jgi:(p)ppGpp synthase/HD superfamily hydrolase
MIEIAKKLAIKSHTDTNCKYDNKPYEVHLQMVVDIANRFIKLIPVKDIENVISACWLHDTIEDCRLTYNDIKVVTNEDIAEIVYALTNEKGKSRSERANDNYYNGIKNTQNASFVKICDRIANYKYSVENNSKMALKYEQEMNNFKSQLFDEKYKPMFDYLQKLGNSNKETILYVCDKGDYFVGINEIEYKIQCPFNKNHIDNRVRFFKDIIVTA